MILMRSLGGFQVEIVEAAGADGAVEVVVSDGINELMRLPGSIHLPAAASSFDPDRVVSPDVTLLRYPGEGRHPAGDYAPVSWYNDVGRGLIRIVQNHRILVLPLLGSQRPEHMPLKARGMRGPSRSADLWLCVAVWCLPLGFTVSELVTSTGISQLTVRKWIEMMIANGLMAYDPLLSSMSREYRYRMIADQRKALENFVVENWREWKSGTGHPSLRPRYLSFVAQKEWRTLRPQVAKAQLGVFPSGITVLEGGVDVAPKAWLTGSSSIPELFLYCPQRSLEALTDLLGSPVLEKRPPEEVVASTICVLEDDHPALQLVDRRRTSQLYAYLWPWGLAALDALDHRDARVRSAAHQAWTEWVANQDIESGKQRLRND